MRAKSKSIEGFNEPSSKSSHVSLSIHPLKSARKAALRKERQKLEALRSGDAFVKKVNKQSNYKKKCSIDARQDEVVPTGGTACERECERGVGGEPNSVSKSHYEELLDGNSWVENERYHVEGNNQCGVFAPCQFSCLEDFGLADQIHQGIEEISKDSELNSISLKSNDVSECNDSIAEYSKQTSKGLNGCSANGVIEYLASWDESTYASNSGSFETGVKSCDSSYQLLVPNHAAESTVLSDLSVSQCASVYQQTETAARKEKSHSKYSSGGYYIADLEFIDESEIQHFEIQLSTSSMNRIDEMRVDAETRNQNTMRNKNKATAEGLTSFKAARKSIEHTSSDTSRQLKDILDDDESCRRQSKCVLLAHAGEEEADPLPKPTNSINELKKTGHGTVPTSLNVTPSQRELKQTEHKAFAISLKPLKESNEINGYVETDLIQLKNHEIDLLRNQISQLELRLQEKCSLEMCFSGTEDSCKKDALIEQNRGLERASSSIQSSIKLKSAMEKPISLIANSPIASDREVPTKMSMVKSFFRRTKHHSRKNLPKHAC
jgi:hypothetical protein